MTFVAERSVSFIHLREPSERRLAGGDRQPRRHDCEAPRVCLPRAVYVTLATSPLSSFNCCTAELGLQRQSSIRPQKCRGLYGVAANIRIRSSYETHYFLL